METTKSPKRAVKTVLKVRMASLAIVTTAAVSIAGVAGAVRPGAAYADQTGSVRFAQSGPSSWTVPAGVDTATFEVRGAQGGRYGNVSLNGTHPGVGGVVIATLTVTPGETLSLLVGAAGGNADENQSPGTGGIGGGGNGGVCGGVAGGGCSPGAGGGGSSSVYRGGNTLFVAGGGGGATVLGSGGAGGGQIGHEGSDANPASGGSQTAGGTAGHDELIMATDGANNGGFYNGGSGGTLCTCSIVNSGPLTSGYGGGGGGGGWYGGGGGAISGGGGGSSYVSPLAIHPVDWQGANEGAGSITISYGAATAPTIAPDQILRFTTASPTSGTIVSTGYPTPDVDLEFGSLPAGLTLQPDGRIYGRPAAAGTTTILVKAHNAAGWTDFATVMIQVDSPASFTSTAAAAPGTVGQPYSYRFVATGTPEPTIVISSGTLPPGLTLASDGTVSGLPSAAGTFPVRLRAENGLTGYTNNYLDASLVIEPAPQPPVPTPAAPDFTSVTLPPPAASVAEPYSFRFAANGEPAPVVSLASGKLPTALTLGPDGTLSGTPTESGYFVFTLRASNGVGLDATLRVRLTVRALPLLRVANRSTIEGNTGSRLLKFTVGLSRTSTVPVSVKLFTADASAVAGQDYEETAQQVTILPGTRNASVTVRIYGDRLVEPDETFQIMLTAPTAASIGGVDVALAATGTIVNND